VSQPSRDFSRRVTEVIRQIKTNPTIDDGMNFTIADFGETPNPGPRSQAGWKQRRPQTYFLEIFDDRHGLREHEISIDECRHQTLWIDIELGKLEMLLTVRIHEDRLIGNAF